MNAYALTSENRSKASLALTAVTLLVVIFCAAGCDKLNARLYLATAYATEYIPGAPSDDNIRLANQAIAEFQDVLTIDPNNTSAIDGIGSLLYNMAGTPFTPEKFEQSKQFHQK